MKQLMGTEDVVNRGPPRTLFQMPKSEMEKKIQADSTLVTPILTEAATLSHIEELRARTYRLCTHREYSGIRRS